MPKAFSNIAKLEIRTALMEAGLKRFSQSGVRSVRIDDICADVSIAKGSFYAFFPSKEDLFMTIADERDIAHKNDMRVYLTETEGDAETIVNGFFDFMMGRIDSDPVLKIVRDNGELNHLVRKISPGLLADNNRRDKEFLEEVATILQSRFSLPAVDAETLEGLMTLMLSLSMQAGFIAASTNYDNVVKLMRDLFSSHLLKEPQND